MNEQSTSIKWFIQEKSTVRYTTHFEINTIYVLDCAWPPKEFGVSSLGDDSKDVGLTVADDKTHAGALDWTTR